MTDLYRYLAQPPYPGRGILLGRSADNSKAVLAYFIMGRSENSRNRVFEYTEDGIRTRAFDESRMTDPSLIIYHPVRRVGRTTFVSNGDQTDTLSVAYRTGQTPESALRTRTFEPDAPNYTPRISGVMDRDGIYKLSILKSLDGDPSCCCRYFFEYDSPKAGTGHLIHTYEGNGDPLPSFMGEPKPVALGDYAEAHELAEPLWDSLNEENKVSLYVQLTNLASGQRDTCIINKHC